MNKAIFLDRDGTINVDKHYLYRKEEFQFLPGVIQGLKILQDAGYLLIIITNQSGIGRGYFSEDDFKDLNNWMLQELEKNDIYICKVYYCPHIANAINSKYRKECECRKPKSGMYQKAIKEFNIDISKSWAIGDKVRDITICFGTECRGFLVGDSEKEEVIEVMQEKNSNIYYGKDLFNCALRIVSEDNLHS